VNTKKPYQLLLVAACAAMSAPALAQVNFTINGMIEEAVCTPTVSASNSRWTGNVLTLPTVKLIDLDEATKTAGDTQITFDLPGCGKSSSISHMWVHFESGSVDGAGRIIPTTGTGWVRFEIRDVDSSGVMGNLVRAGGTATDQPGSGQGTAAAFTGTYPSRNASKSYIFRYYANQAVTIAGTVSASATYTVKYY